MKESITLGKGDALFDAITGNGLRIGTPLENEEIQNKIIDIFNYMVDVKALEMMATTDKGTRIIIKIEKTEED